MYGPHRELEHLKMMKVGQSSVDDVEDKGNDVDEASLEATTFTMALMKTKKEMKRIRNTKIGTLRI